MVTLVDQEFTVYPRNGICQTREEAPNSLQEEMAVSSFLNIVRSKKLRADNLERIIGTLKMQSTWK
jgi:hypothetical protein